MGNDKYFTEEMIFYTNEYFRANSNFQTKYKGVKDEGKLRKRDSALRKQALADSCRVWLMLRIKYCQEW